MNIQECTPLEARRVFKISPYKNFAIGLGVFGLICAPLALFSMGAWVAGGTAFVVALCVYFYIESRVIFIECPNCRKAIDTSTPWECGFKQCRNENVEEFPFIHECGHCHFVPKAYECHHCRDLIYLTPDRQQIHSAKCLVAPEPVKIKTVVVVKDVIGDKVATQREEIRDLEHQLKKTMYEKEIEVVKNKPVEPSLQTMRDSIKAQMVQMYQRKMTREDIALEMKAVIQKQYGHDVFECDKRLSIINEIMLELM